MLAKRKGTRVPGKESGDQLGGAFASYSTGRYSDRKIMPKKPKEKWRQGL